MTLEDAQRSCRKLENTLIDMKCVSSEFYTGSLNALRRLWEIHIDMKPAKMTSALGCHGGRYTFCTFCQAYLPATVKVCPRCGLVDDSDGSVLHVPCVGPQRDKTGALASVLPPVANAGQSSLRKSSNIASLGRGKRSKKKGAVPSRR